VAAAALSDGCAGHAVGAQAPRTVCTSRPTPMHPHVSMPVPMPIHVPVPEPVVTPMHVPVSVPVPVPVPLGPLARLTQALGREGCDRTPSSTGAVGRTLPSRRVAFPGNAAAAAAATTGTGGSGGGGGGGGGSAGAPPAPWTGNRVRTARYTLLSFFPLQLWQQFSKVRAVGTARAPRC
jgi:hypothetical protein